MSKPWALISVGAGIFPMFPLEHPASLQVAYRSRVRSAVFIATSSDILGFCEKAFTPRADALARIIVLSVYLTTNGRPLAVCRISDLPEATATALMHAIQSRWLELKDNRGVCLTAEGRRLALRQAN